MAELTSDNTQTRRKLSGRTIVLGLLLALVSGVGAFSLTSGVLNPLAAVGEKTSEMISTDLAFVPIQPMTVALGKPSERRFLRFRAELEVKKPYRSDIETLMPRVVDVLNTYLQTLEMKDVEEPSSLLVLRSQMRRRIDLIVGENRVRDLLIMEFVVN